MMKNDLTHIAELLIGENICTFSTQCDVLILQEVQ